LRLPQKTKANKTRGLSVRERIHFADKCGKISHKISLKNIDSHRLYRKKLNRCKYRIGEMRISISQQYRYIVRIPIHDAKYRFPLCIGFQIFSE
jgi:hypothetical protein